MMELSDFSNTFSKRPKISLHTKNVTDLLEALKIATKLNLKIGIRGAGYSSLQGLSSDVLVCNYSTEEQQARWIDENLLEVSARSTLANAASSALYNGRWIACLQHFRHFSVGGSVSVGGIGVDSIKYGSQIHHVHQLELVTSSGEVLTCNKEKNADVFRFALGGLGQLGIIEKVVYKTYSAHPFFSRIEVTFSDSESLLLWLEQFANISDVIKLELDYMWVIYVQKAGKYVAMVGKRFETQEEASKWRVNLSFNLNTMNVNIVVGCGRWTGEPKLQFSPNFKYIYNDYCLPNWSAFHRFCLNQNVFSKCESLKNSIIVIYPIMPQKDSLPLSLVHPLLGNSMNFDIGIFLSSDSTEEIAKLQNLAEEHLEACISEGGRPYNYGYCKLSEIQCNKVYGEAFYEFTKLKKQMDPLGLWQRYDHNALFL